MVRTQKLPKLTFTISPNANGYVIGCSEISYLFTDTGLVEEIDQTIRTLISDYVENFPDDSQKRGIYKDIVTQIVWKGSPNSVALE
ncbi:MAG: hypothetical protein WA799_05700 [Nitrosotalea sp.]